MKKIFLSFLLSLFFIQQVNACGIFLSEEGTNVRVDHMNVILSYDESNNKQDIIVNMDYLVNQGKVNEFGWLMPFPSQPSVDKYEGDIFQILEKETTPKKNLLEKLYDRLKMDTSKGVSKGTIEMNSSNTIEILEEKKIGVFDVSVVKAKNTEDIMEWSKKNKFHISWLKSGMLEEYIKKDWYFVLMKLNQNGLLGDIDPVKFSFNTEKPIYPIELTKYDRTGKYNPEKTIPITLYLIGTNKMTPSNYQMEYVYGGKLSENTKKEFSFPQNKEKMITKWSTTFLGEEVKDDINFSDKNNIENKNDGTMTKSEVTQLIILILLLPFILIYKLIIANTFFAVIVFALMSIPLYIAITKKSGLLKQTITFIFYTYILFGLIVSMVIYQIIPAYLFVLLFVLIIVFIYEYKNNKREGPSI